MMTMIISNG